MADPFDSDFEIDCLDSLDVVEHMMAIEEARERGEPGGDEGDAIAGLVRNPGPREPKGQSGAEAPPVEPDFD